MSQPVLLNQLNERLGISLHTFRENEREEPELQFDYAYHPLRSRRLRFAGRQPLWLNQFLARRQWGRSLRDHLDESYDVVITMNDVGPATVGVADDLGVPSLFFLRNLAGSGQELYRRDQGHLENFLNADMGGKVQYPFLVRNFAEYKTGLERATVVVANSQYVANRIERDFGVASEVVYPPIALEEIRVDRNEGDAIGMVNPRNEFKGGDIFFDIAEHMPSEQFLSAGAIRSKALQEQANSLDNLTHLGWCEDMREFYRRTKLIVVPSRGSEAFGRAAAEPMVSGIPTVVSDRGGLPEVVGDTGEVVTEIDSTDAWIGAIDRALEDHAPEQQIERARRFSADRQGEKLAEIVSAVT